jgi:hypothetical protein
MQSQSEPAAQLTAEDQRALNRDVETINRAEELLLSVQAVARKVELEVRRVMDKWKVWSPRCSFPGRTDHDSPGSPGQAQAGGNEP